MANSKSFRPATPDYLPSSAVRPEALLAPSFIGVMPPFSIPLHSPPQSGSSRVDHATVMAVNLSQSNAALDQLSNSLKTRDHVERQVAAQQLRDLVKVVQANLSDEMRNGFYGSLTKRVIELAAFANPVAYRLGSIAAISSTVDLLEISAIHRYLTAIRFNLPCNNTEVMQAAGYALERALRAINSSPDSTSLVESLGNWAIERLEDPAKADFDRYGAVLTIESLAANAPLHFYPALVKNITKLWIGLRDAKEWVRIAAGHALGKCLHALEIRAYAGATQTVVESLFKNAQDGLTVTSGTAKPLEVVHGSLLCLKHLFEETPNLMKPFYKPAIKVASNLTRYRDLTVRRTILRDLTPLFARYDPTYFAQYHLHQVVTQLLTIVRSEKERQHRETDLLEDAITTMGDLALAEGALMRDYTEPVMTCIKEALLSSALRRSPLAASVLWALRNLARAVGGHITRYIPDLLDPLFACGLSTDLVHALRQVVAASPVLLHSVQIRLLNTTSLILIGEPYRSFGYTTVAPLLDGTDSSLPLAGERNSALVRVALASLREFDMSGHPMSEFVRDCTLPYLGDESSNTRREATITCLHMYSNDPISRDTSPYAIELVNDVLDKVMAIAVADPEDGLRADALCHLGPRFDLHLAQDDFVRSLFIACNDQNFKVRAEGIKILGRISKINPGYIMPALRSALIQLVGGIELATQTKDQEEATRLLTLVIRAAPSLVRDYAVPLLNVLMTKLNNPSPQVVASALICLGELAKLSGEDLGFCVDELASSVVAQLLDSEGDGEVVKRNAALQALGLIASNTGTVVGPIVKNVGLLDAFSRILKTSTDKTTRQEVSRVLGLLGAVDPSKFKQHSDLPDGVSTDPPTSDPDMEIFDTGARYGHNSEEYSQHTVVSILMRMLKDPSLADSHQAVVESLILMVQEGGLKSTWLPQIAPTFILKVVTAPAKYEFYWEQLANLVRAVERDIEPYVPDIIGQITQHWSSVSASRQAIVSCIDALCSAIGMDIKVHVPRIIPPMLLVLDAAYDGSTPTALYVKILHTLQLLGPAIEDSLLLIVPVVARMFERRDLSPPTRKAAIVAIGQLSRKVDLSTHSGVVVQSLCRVVGSTDGENELRNAAMDTLSALVVQLGTGYAVFIPSVDRVLLRHDINQPLYEKLVAKLLKGEKLAQDLIPDAQAPAHQHELPSKNSVASNPVHLRRSWQLGKFTTDKEWEQWMMSMAEAFLVEAPSLAIRGCKPVLSVYPALALELFSTSFVMCQPGLPEDYKRDLEYTLSSAYASSLIPKRIVHSLLDLAEVMEHCHEPIPRDISLLANKSYTYGFYAKSLHYKEAEYFEDQSPTVIEALIDINTRLRQSDSALGALSLAQDTWEITNRERWYEKLHRWDDALTAYTERGQLETLRYGGAQMGTQLGKMRCLYALGQYQELEDAVRDAWQAGGTKEDIREIAFYGAAAAWPLQQWDALDQFTQYMSLDNKFRSFYRAALCINGSERERAHKHIDRARDAIDLDLASALSGGYGRSYEPVMHAQMLAELEEALVYKLDFADQPDRQASLRRTWLKRLEGCQPEVEVWQPMLSIHSMVVTPIEDQEARIKFASLCRHQGRMTLASKTLCDLMGIKDPVASQVDAAFYTNPTPRLSPAVSYAHLKLRWASSDHDSRLVLSDLRKFTGDLACVTGVVSKDQAALWSYNGLSGVSSSVHPDLLKLLARCYFKQGDWQRFLNTRRQWIVDESCDVLESLRRATELDRTWYKAWHAWGEANFDVVQYNEDYGVGDGIVERSIVPAITGFFKSIILSPDRFVLQMTLRILALWFKWGNEPEVEKAMSEGFASVTVDTWLDVIPQIIARIGTNARGVRDQIKHLLSSVGAAHPQALICSLSVATKSNAPSRIAAANDIVSSMRDHAPTLVDQAMVVSHELIRLAVLWPELWYEGLDEASRLFYHDHNEDAMFRRLDKLHTVIDSGAETIREMSFVHRHGRNLREAHEFARRYREYGDTNDLNTAWEYYYKVFRSIASTLPAAPTLDLQSCTPRLLKMTDFELAVPGLYKPASPVVRIQRFEPVVQTIASKQRPRRVRLVGSNDKVYQYLLKGHEDLRQDERAMQLFGLINGLLAQDPKAAKRDLRMRRFPVIPLSPNTGMLGWVDNTDTLHLLIKEYRDSRGILLNVEHRLMLQMAPDYENLPLLQKVEVFKFAQSKVKGNDLYNALWLRSYNSESWVERRINYTRSLGVSAVAGYILGLGDRHPSNLLLDRYTGELVHIDFGDCFEVAMQRAKYPEKVPFRLTRMLTNAMEVGGIRGTFRIASEIVMKVVRNHQASMFTLLEAFVHDPLIGWRLVKNPTSAAADALADRVDDVPGDADSRNSRAVQVIKRVHSKLEGLDFDTTQPLGVRDQMQRLVAQATDVSNLCGAFLGWCAFW